MKEFTNAEKRTWEEQSLYTRVDNLDSDELPTANIVLAGITGTGKSTLINAIFGSKLAKTGKGKPITEHIGEYHSPEIPIRIWDTVGIELDAEKTKKSISDIKKVIAQKALSKDQFDRIHAIWYCIHSGSNRYQGVELEFIKSLHSVGVPFLIVLTQCIGREEEVEFEEKINEYNASVGMTDISTVRVCAEEFKLANFVIPSFGLDYLVDATIKKMPDYIKSGFTAAQRVNRNQKREQCEAIIYDYVRAAKNGFWDKIPLINILCANSKIKGMLIKIGIMYNTVLKDENVDKIIKRCNIDFENVFPALLNPFVSEYSEKVNNLLSSKKKEGFEVKIDSFSKSERVARMIAFYGYTFIDSIEEVWEKLTEKQLQDIDMVVRELMAIINKKLDERRKGR